MESNSTRHRKGKNAWDVLEEEGIPVRFNVQTRLFCIAWFVDEIISPIFSLGLKYLDGEEKSVLCDVTDRG